MCRGLFILFCSVVLFVYVNCELEEVLTTTEKPRNEQNEDIIETTTQLHVDNEETTTELSDSEKDFHSDEETTTENLDESTQSTQSTTISEETTTFSDLSETTAQDKYTSTVRLDQFSTNVEVTESTVKEEQDTKKPFYHDTIKELVKVVETNLLEDVQTEQLEVTTTEKPLMENNATEERLDRLSDQIRAIIRHYQTYGEVTVPNADVPDPMDIPDVKKTFGGSPTTFTTMKMYGMSDFKVAHINTDLNKMQVYVSVIMKRLMIIGNYSIKSFFMKKNGPFNVTLLDVETDGAAELKKDENGTLQASDSTMDMSFRDAIVDFKNLGMVGSLLQGVLATAAPVLFEAIKPVVLKELNEKIRNDLNGKLKKVGNRIALSGSRPPLDAAVEEGRIYIKENGYDPYHIKDFSVRQNVFAINITEFVLEGLSRFQRVGEMVLAMDEGTLQMGPHVAALDLIGRCKWGIGIGKTFKKQGYTNFTIDHVQVKAIVNQSLDLRTKPKLDRLDVNVGKVNVNMEGAGRFDIIVEVMVNTLPDLIRHIFIDAIEIPLRYKVQQILNKIEPETVLEKGLPELDNLGL